MKTEQQFSAPVNKWRTWRAVNLAVIVLAFCTPWFVSYDYQTYYGLMTIVGSAAWTIYLLTGQLWRVHSVMDVIAYTAIVMVFLGLCSILVYSVLNFYVVWRNSELISKPIWAKLASTSLTISSIALLFGAYLDGPYLLWGYWLLSLGLASSIWLEIKTYRSRSVNNQSHLSE